MQTLIRDLIFTPKCICCSLLGQAVCTFCLSKLPIIRKSNIAYVDKLVCAADYSGWLKDRVIEYKSGNYELGRGLAQVVIEKCLAEMSNYPIVPIPTSKEKLRIRQIDTIGHLARQIKLSAPKNTLNHALVLNRNVQDQVGLSKSQRISNLADAFICLKKISTPIILLDDVITTGATMSAAAKALVKAGAPMVFAVGLCAAS